MSIEELREQERKAERALDMAYYVVHEREGELIAVQSKICRAYKEIWQEYIDKKVRVLTEVKRFGNTYSGFVEGYLLGVGHDSQTSCGYYLEMSKVKKNGEKSLNIYSMYDSPKVEEVKEIELV